MSKLSKHHANKLKPGWIEKERARDRKRKKTEKKKPIPNKVALKRVHKFRAQYPEKYKAANAIRYFTRGEGMQFHHWSYNKEHHKDCIELSILDHAKAHRFIIYDQERMMYRRTDNMELLDTKNKHLKYILRKIKNEPN